MSRFETDTAVTPTDMPGALDYLIDDGWWVSLGPNGGYVAAIAARALDATYDTDERPLRSLTMHYAKAPVAGPASIRIETIREGRSVTFATARMLQGDTVFATAQAVLAVETGSLELHTPRALPELPGDDDVMRPPPDAKLPPFAQRFDYVPTVTPAEGEARSGGWLRPREPSVLDAPLVAALTDSWFPALFAVTGPTVAVPTLDLTIHIRAPLPLPAEWVFGEFVTTEAARGFMEEDARLWAADGTLLAQARQLAVIR